MTVRIILDAESAQNEYSLHGALRTYGVSVKVENWGGTEHTKAFSVDGYIVVLGSQNFTSSGSWNFTINDTYGSEANRAAGVLSGHTNHGVEIRSTALADEYINEFEEMYGSSTATPSSTASNFHGRKT